MKLHEAIKEKRREADILSEVQRVFPDAFLRDDGKIVARSATRWINEYEMADDVVWFIAKNRQMWPSLPDNFEVYAFGLEIRNFAAFILNMRPGAVRDTTLEFLKVAAEECEPCDDDIPF